MDHEPPDVLDEAESYARDLLKVCDPVSARDMINDIDTALRFASFARKTEHIFDRRAALSRLKDLLPNEGQDELHDRIDAELKVL